MAQVVDPSTDITSGLTDPSQGAGGGFEGTGVRKGPGRKNKPFRLIQGGKGKGKAKREFDPKEEAQVKRFWKNYEAARKFDEGHEKGRPFGAIKR